jgi:hypothetical protein
MPMIRSQSERTRGSAAASRPAPSPRQLIAALVAGVAWVAACATAPPLTVVDPTAFPPDAGRASQAALLLEAEQAQMALTSAEQVRAREASNRDATLLAARALIAVGRSDDAGVALSALSGDPDALLLTGRIAERRHSWETAMNLYESLPADNPERTASLLRAKLEWRSSNLPLCAQQAIASPRLTRSDLAVLLVSLAPQLEALVGGRSPVLSDIVDLPCLRGVLTAVRFDLLGVDRLDHSFFPFRAARPEEVRSAVESLCHVLDLKPPVWCEEGGVAAGCTLVSDPVRGQQVADMVSQLMEGERP